MEVRMGVGIVREFRHISRHPFAVFVREIAVAYMGHLTTSQSELLPLRIIGDARERFLDRGFS